MHKVLEREDVAVKVERNKSLVNQTLIYAIHLHSRLMITDVYKCQVRHNTFLNYLEIYDALLDICTQHCKGEDIHVYRSSLNPVPWQSMYICIFHTCATSWIIREPPGNGA